MHIWSKYKKTWRQVSRTLAILSILRCALGGDVRTLWVFYSANQDIRSDVSKYLSCQWALATLPWKFPFDFHYLLLPNSWGSSHSLCFSHFASVGEPPNKQPPCSYEKEQKLQEGAGQGWVRFFHALSCVNFGSCIICSLASSSDENWMRVKNNEHRSWAIAPVVLSTNLTDSSKSNFHSVLRL